MSGYTTQRVLDRGGRESNPVLAWIIARVPGRSWMLVELAIAGTAIVILWLVGPQFWGLVTLALLIAAYARVVRHNWTVSERMDRR